MEPAPPRLRRRLRCQLRRGAPHPAGGEQAPYSNYNQEEKWVYAPSYAHEMRVFFSRISLRKHDKILIKDRWGGTVQTIQGPVEHTDFWTKIVDGNRIKIVLKPDGYHTDWGFRITAQRYVWDGYHCQGH